MGRVYNAFIRRPVGERCRRRSQRGRRFHRRGDPARTRGWKNAGAKNVVVFTQGPQARRHGRFVAVLKAGGIWFGAAGSFDSSTPTPARRRKAFMTCSPAAAWSVTSAGASILGISSCAGRRRTTTTSWTTRATRRASHICAAWASTSTSWRASGSPDRRFDHSQGPKLLGVSEDREPRGSCAATRRRSSAATRRSRTTARPRIPASRSSRCSGDKYNLNTRRHPPRGGGRR